MRGSTVSLRAYRIRQALPNDIEQSETISIKRESKSEKEKNAIVDYVDLS